jgi:toxin FitB
LKYLLDTDVLSQPTKKTPNPQVVRWIDEVAEEDLFLSVVSLQETQTGIDLMPFGRRRRDLEAWLRQAVAIRFAGRILPIDDLVALDCGHLVATAKKAGHTPGLGDVFLAATARVHGLQLATLNRKHYTWFDVKLVTF